jgi:hypothetical protein
MSDRQAVARYGGRLAVVCVIWILPAGGCKQATTAPSPPAQTAPADRPAVAARPSPKPPEQAPLLLEEEPTGKTSAQPAADNSRCFVCHANYLQEKIAVTHANAGIGCARCHGASDAHIADESWASGGNGTAPDLMYPRSKINPACMHCHAKDKIDAPQHVAVLADTEGKQVCTDCHGSHRLPQRRCKWK